MRLPYGKRTGVTAVDRLNIIAHDKFQEIINEANRPDSTIRLQAVVLAPEDLGQKTKTVVSQSTLANKLGIQPAQATPFTEVAGSNEPMVFQTQEEQKVAQITYEVIQKLESQLQKLPSVSYLNTPEVQAEVIRHVAAQYRPAQLELEGVTKQPDIAAVVKKATALVIQQRINIPRILVVPKSEAQSGFKFFTATEPPQGFQQSPTDKSNMAKYLFGGFTRCLYSEWVPPRLLTMGAHAPCWRR